MNSILCHEVSIMSSERERESAMLIARQSSYDQKGMADVCLRKTTIDWSSEIGYVQRMIRSAKSTRVYSIIGYDSTSSQMGP